jgi:hypothetical protein
MDGAVRTKPRPGRRQQDVADWRASPVGRNANSLRYKELQQNYPAAGVFNSYILSGSEQAAALGDYLSTFWDYDHSPHAKEKLRKNHGIHRYYRREQQLTVQKYCLPFFKGRLPGNMAKKDIEAFMDSLDNGDRKLSADGTF